MNSPRLGRSRKENGKFLVQGSGGTLGPRNGSLVRAGETLGKPAHILSMESVPPGPEREVERTSAYLSASQTSWFGPL